MLKGKSALVTGSSGGIGLAIAQELATAGCNVILHGLEPLSQVSGELALLNAKGVQAVYHQSPTAHREAETAKAHRG